MSASTDPTADPELVRLLDDYGQAEYEWGAVAHTDAGMHGDLGHRKHAAMAASRALLLSHLDAAYVRRDSVKHYAYLDRMTTALETRIRRAATRLPPSPPGSYKAARGILPWKPGDELPEERIRRLRDGADGAPSWRGWRATVGNGRVRHNRTDAVGRIVMDTDAGVDVAWDGTDGVVFYDRYEAVDKLEPEDDR